MHRTSFAEKRAQLLPNVPTLDESGIPGFDLSSWWGVVGPAGMPPDVVNALNIEIGKLRTPPELSKFLASEGAEAGTMTPPEFAELIRAEIGRWIKVAHEAIFRWIRVGAVRRLGLEH